MELSAKTRLGPLLDKYPFLLDFLLAKSPVYSKLKNPLLRKTLAKVAPLSQAAAMGGFEETALLFEIAAEIFRRTGEPVTVANAGGEPRAEPPEAAGAARDAAVESLGEGQSRAERVRVLKDIVMRLHRGEQLADVRAEFHELLHDVSPAEIGAMEQELVADGVPESEIKRLCELHVELFTAGTEAPELPPVLPGHPLHTYRAENREAEAKAAKLQEAAGQARDPLTFEAARAGLLEGVRSLARIVRHYERKENQLFPVMEQHGLTAPPQVMWEIHDDIRARFRKALALLEEDAPEAGPYVAELCVAVRDMVFKEERVLFPMVWAAFSDADWARVRRGEEEIGYAWITPGDEWHPEALPETAAGRGAALGAAMGAELGTDQGTGAQAASGAGGRVIDLDAGQLRPEVLNAILKTLPVDLTFVDANDRVAYFSQTEERIFPRSPGIIGREVSKCHPPKSVHMVEAILRAFHAGERDTAEFWIPLGGRFIHIRYFAVRRDGTYLGCLEVSQDVTAIRALTGQKRLLEWE
ncbi:protein of unknown function DUF438 [Desulfovibrio sp. X2]|uniref:DUF438 domain-containing protein n=1 Tax=Desulfovibrio sp. X2 TaxID=941449 RepID=UPI0003588025|nr:DUF438 domain-containing protein [Desulfovibrio sp. X2]EPR41431.1 protein of unknown function DUF438 [Desulfovibrio sp. X2]